MMIHYHPQRSCEGYVFTSVCHSVHRGGTLQVVSQHALQQVSQGGGLPALAGGSAPGGGCLLGDLLPGGGVPAQGSAREGGYGGRDPSLESRWLLLRTVASYWNAFLFYSIFCPKFVQRSSHMAFIPVVGGSRI